MLWKVFRFIKRKIKRYEYRHSFRQFGKESSLVNPLKIQGAERIVVEDNVSIANLCWLAAVPLTGCDDCELVFKTGSTVGDFCHIYSTKSIIVEKDALIANFVYVSDNLHCYENVDMSVKFQPISQLKSVVLGEGCWIGEHVAIIGASVGKHSVIGANSVVTHDIPDFCVAVGAPARIVKRYNSETRKWQKTDKNGNFI